MKRKNYIWATTIVHSVFYVIAKCLLLKTNCATFSGLDIIKCWSNYMWQCASVRSQHAVQSEENIWSGDDDGKHRNICSSFFACSLFIILAFHLIIVSLRNLSEFVNFLKSPSRQSLSTGTKYTFERGNILTFTSDILWDKCNSVSLFLLNICARKKFH